MGPLLLPKKPHASPTLTALRKRKTRNAPTLISAESPTRWLLLEPPELKKLSACGMTRTQMLRLKYQPKMSPRQTSRRTKQLFKSFSRKREVVSANLSVTRKLTKVV